MRFSVIIPFQFHRSRALDCVRGWLTTQALPASEFELICVLSANDPDRLRGPINDMLRPHDRLILSNEEHDIGQCAEGAAAARGDFLLFTESHAWPEHDVLVAALAAFDRHPDWAAFSGSTTAVTPTLLGRIEAAHYERDIVNAMTEHPWRKILDQCFVTRRGAYFDAGGFDPSLEHFAEWALAARYFDLGLTVGYAPEVTLRHFTSGDIDELCAFTRSFAEGEIEFFARGRATDSVMWREMPQEWGKRGAFDRRLASALATCLRKALFMRSRPAAFPVLLKAYTAWSLLAASGAGMACRAADLRVAFDRLLLSAALAAGPQSMILRRFSSLLGAVILSQRLHEIAVRLHVEEPAQERTEIELADDRHAGRMAGFHMAERQGAMPMRWSRPAALIALPPTRGSLHIHCAPLREPLGTLALAFFIDEVPVPRDRIAFDAHSALISLADREPGPLRLAWVCEPFAAPRDKRRLGLPVSRIALTRG